MPEADTSHLVKLQCTISKPHSLGKCTQNDFYDQWIRKKNETEQSVGYSVNHFEVFRPNILMAVFLLPNAVLLLPSEQFALIMRNSAWKLFMYCSNDPALQNSTTLANRLQIDSQVVQRIELLSSVGFPFRNASQPWGHIQQCCRC